MTDSLRKQGTAYKRALATFGKWCARVASDNPHVRNDMYSRLYDCICAKPPPVRKAGKIALANNIHAIWMQLVDDFSMQREAYTPKDLELCVIWDFLFC